MPGKTNIIDIHQHVNWLGKHDEDLISYMDNAGVDKCWLLSWESVDGGLEQGYQHLSISDVYKTFKKYPKRIVPFCGVDPRRRDAEDILETLHKRGFRGYGELKFRILADNPDFIRMLRLAGKLKMPSLCHLDVDIPATPQWYLGDISHFERAAKLCPNTAMIGHGPGFWREISGDAEKVDAIYPTGKVVKGGRLEKVLEANKNVFADLSAGSALKALSRDVVYTKKLLTKFRKKIMYGTDYYDTRMLEFLKSLKLDKGVFSDIIGGNAKRLLP
ncbi:MAG: amidohydrolase family protein [Fibrobacteres bacterium]|nr:amidohydrolase family protein [Fibrobacterota bacterium]